VYLKSLNSHGEREVKRERERELTVVKLH